MPPDFIRISITTSDVLEVSQWSSARSVDTASDPEHDFYDDTLTRSHASSLSEI